jgi:hypothetical protein
MKLRSAPLKRHQSHRALAVISGPLSIRTSSGPAPRSPTIWSSTRVVWSASIERATPHRQRLAGVLVDDMEQFQRAAVAGGVELEVQGPDMVGALGSQRVAGTVDSPSHCRLRFRCRTGPTLDVQLCRTLNFNSGTVTAAASWPRRASGDRSKNTANRTAVAAPGPSRALSQSQVGKILEIHQELPGRIHIVRIRQRVGF